MQQASGKVSLYADEKVDTAKSAVCVSVAIPLFPHLK